MSPSPSHAEPLAIQLARLEQRVETLEERDTDKEMRLRTIEAAYLRLAGKISLLAVVGSTLGAAAVQWFFRVVTP